MIALPTGVLSRDSFIEFRNSILTYSSDLSIAGLQQSIDDEMYVVDDLISNGFSVQRAYQILMEGILYNRADGDVIDYTQKDIIDNVTPVDITPTGVYLDDDFLNEEDVDAIDFREDYFDIDKDFVDPEILPKTAVLSVVGDSIGQLKSITSVAKGFQLDVSSKITDIQTYLLNIVRNVKDPIEDGSNIDTPSIPINVIMASIEEKLSPIKNMLTEAVIQKNTVDSILSILPENDSLLSYLPRTDHLNAKINRVITIALNDIKKLSENVQLGEIPPDNIGGA